MRAEAAAGLTYPLHIKDDYDIEAAYLECGSTKIMASSTNQKALKLAWVHCDLAKKLIILLLLRRKRPSITGNMTGLYVYQRMFAAAFRRCTAQ